MSHKVLSIHICVIDIGLDAMSPMMDVTGLIAGRKWGAERCEIFRWGGIAPN